MKSNLFGAGFMRGGWFTHFLVHIFRTFSMHSNICSRYFHVFFMLYIKWQFCFRTKAKSKTFYFFIFEPNGNPFGSKSKRKLSLRSYPIHCERKWKYNFLSVIYNSVEFLSWIYLYKFMFGSWFKHFQVHIYFGVLSIYIIWCISFYWIYLFSDCIYLYIHNR